MLKHYLYFSFTFFRCLFAGSDIDVPGVVPAPPGVCGGEPRGAV